MSPAMMFTRMSYTLEGKKEKERTSTVNALRNYRSISVDFGVLLEVTQLDIQD